MAYQKRRSTVIEKAQTRLRGAQSVHLAINLGNGLTLQSYADLVAASIAQLEALNLALAEADRARIEFFELEASVSNLSSRVLSAVGAIYGRDSKEYEMVGGTPPSRYKRSKKQATTPGTDQPQDQNGSTDLLSLNGSTANGAGQITPVD